MPNDYTLYDFQEEGVKFIQKPRDNGYGYSCPPNYGLIGDEMGLGKTAQALSIIKDLVLNGKRILFLVPGATIIQWQKQFDRWVLDCEPDEFVPGLAALRSSNQFVPMGCSVVLSHNLLAKKEVVEKLAKLNFDGIVIDEIHKFGSLGTKRIQHLNALINLSKDNCRVARIGLSGTPVRNYAKELYNICHFLDALRFRTYEDFARKYLTYDRKALWNPHQFHADFAPYYIRRTVGEVQKSLPPIRRTKLYCEITDPYLRMLYNKQLDLMSNFMNNATKVDAFSLLGYLVKLRHITGIAKAKEPAIIEPIMDYLDEGNKALIGLHHHFVYDRLKKSLNGYESYLIRGGMDGFQKERAKEDFIKAAAPSICYLSIKAAGEGIDGLQHSGCHKAYVFEQQWNMAEIRQFEGRIHRDGQKQNVDIETTIAVGTIDEFFDELSMYKMRVSGQATEANYEGDPVFIKELASKAVSGRLSISAEDIRIFEQAVKAKQDIEENVVNL